MVLTFVVKIIRRQIARTVIPQKISSPLLIVVCLKFASMRWRESYDADFFIYSTISMNPRLIIITAIAASSREATLANALEPPSPITR